MKRLFLSLLLSALPQAVFAAPSGVDTQGLKENLRAAGEGVNAGLRAADARYRLLVSSESVDPQAYLAYRDQLAETGEAVKNISGHVKEYSDFVQKLEDAEPKPDDMNELRSLKAYAEGLNAAAESAYSLALRKLDQVAAKLEQAGAALAPSSDPALREKEKQRQLQAAEKARAMGDKAREFAAIRQVSGLDPAQGGQMMGKFFDGLSPAERGAFSEQLKAPAVKAGASLALLTPGGRPPKPLYRPMGAVVPVMGGAQDITAVQPAGGNAAPADGAGSAAKKSKPLLSGSEFRGSMWSAVGRFSPELAAPHLREAALSKAADSKSDWLGKKRQDFLDLAARAKDEGERAGYERTAAGIDALLAKRGTISAIDGVDQRSTALGEWSTSVSKLMDGSREGKTERDLLDRKAAMDAEYGALKTDEERARWIKANGAGYNAAGGKLAEFYAGSPEYLAARKTEAEAQRFLRANMPNFRDGTQFTADELGLPLPPGQKVSVGSLKDGARGLSFTDASGLAHFQSFDDTVRVNEVLDKSGEKRTIEMRLARDGTVNTAERQADGKLFRTEVRKPDGTVTVEVYGPDGKAAASTLRKSDGSTVEALVMGKEGVTRTVYTDPKGAATYEVASLAGKDGYPKQSGRIVNGVMVPDRIDLDANTVKVRTGDNLFETRTGGKATGAEVDMESIKRLPEAGRAGAIRAAADSLAGGDPAKAGPLAQFMTQASRQGGAGARMNLVSANDDKGNPLYLATIVAPDGSQKQVLGQWDKLTKAEAAGLSSDVGLNISVRSGAPGEDMSKRNYLKLFRFSGDNITDRYGSESRVTGNWFVGYGAEADNFIHRSYTGTNQDFKTIKTGTEELYTSPTIFGHVGGAVGTLGKGAVQLTGSAIAVVGAGTVGWADSNLQNEFLERAKSNFYGNDVSRSLGQNYIGDYYNKGYETMKVDDTRNIQNVGKEMASMGRPTLGAVLQGGVEFSNGVATDLITGGLTRGIPAGKAGTVRTLATKGYGIYSNGQAVYDAGASGVEFIQASRAFNESDPASKERYYAAVTGLTSSVLSAPKTLGGAMQIKGDLKDMKTAWKGEAPPSTILGADGKPYQKPPEELSDFKKFMLEQNGPGILTRTFNKDLGMDREIGTGFLSKNPVSAALDKGEKWVDSKVDKWLGKPAEMPGPTLIVPGHVEPKPDAEVAVPGHVEPKPEARIVAPGQVEPKPDVKIVVPGQAVPKPDAKIVLPGEVEPKPDAKIILTGGG